MPNGRGRAPNLMMQARLTASSRFLAALVALAIGGLALLAVRPASAAPAFSVSLEPVALAFPAGSDAVLRVRLEGQVAMLPSLGFDVHGGDLVAIDPLAPVGPSAAEGAITVHRPTPGTVQVSASFGGVELATAQARFDNLGIINVTVSLQADANAAARTWRYQVENASGAVVDTLEVNTSGDALTSTEASVNLPYGAYTVRQLLGSDTKLACGGDTFYALTDPATGAATVDLAAAMADVHFSIQLCPGAPRLSFVAPVDPLAPVSPADVAPGETPINEVRGVRSNGPGAGLTPRAPATGSGAAPAETPSQRFPLLLAAALLMFPLTMLAGVRVAVHGSRRR